MATSPSTVWAASNPMPDPTLCSRPALNVHGPQSAFSACLPAWLQFRQPTFKLEFKARQGMRLGAAASNEEARDQLNNIIPSDAAFGRGIGQQALLHLRRLFRQGELLQLLCRA
jgi:hypothetical protein